MAARPRIDILSAVLIVAAAFSSPTRAETSVAQLLGAKPDVDFVRDVQPIFRANCYQCHGPQKQKALLRWDSRESAVQHGGQSGPEILAGKSTDSRLIQRVLGLNGEDRMPLNKPALSAAEINTLKAWIDQGAHWPDSASVKDAKIERHWAYVKPVRPAVPQVGDSTWPRNPVDSFVLANLQSHGLRPSPEADRATLIRRVSLDLTGLPPTIAEADAFANDTSPDAYEKVLDRLLASPHFGERAAIRWLDLARYADSNGYEKDRRRSMWPYRDWVINALNADMPFNEFTIEQLAGDLLPHPTQEQKIATGFNRNTMLNEEGGVDPEEYRFNANIDRVDATATVWLGATLRCAQCHNHKYDPFTMKDYYSFLAYFNSAAVETSKRTGSDPTDVSARVTVQTPELLALEKQASSIQAELDRPTIELAAAQAKWELQQRDAIWMALDPQELTAPEGVRLSKQVDGSILVARSSPGSDTYSINATTHLAGITAIRLDVLSKSPAPDPHPARPKSGTPVTELQLYAAPLDSSDALKRIPLRDVTADFSPDKFPSGYGVAEESRPTSARSTPPAVPNAPTFHVSIFETARDVGSKSGTRLTFSLASNLIQAGQFRIVVTTSAHPVATSIPPEKIQVIVSTPDNERTGQQRRDLAAYYRTIAPLLNSTRGKLAALRKEIDEYPKTSLVMQELPTPRETHVHVRGAFLTLGQKVSPATPSLFGASSAASQSRLDLARWLVSDENPLTARVTVNRIWEQFFGTGIVATSEDFGTQGEPPSDQPLLDWLAIQFMHPAGGQKPWSLKAIYRLIAMSATYRQSSNVTPALLEKDPYNRLLARGPRFRLPAELIRDQALAASGLLSEKMGGPSVFPIQPEGIWHSPYSGDRWMTSPGEDRYRRGVYTFLRRSAPYPQFMAFDMTTHESICTRRSRTDTALQALTTLNDPSFVQPAAALARRILAEAPDSPADRITFAFRTVLTRAPNPAESTRLLSLYDQMLEKYEADPQAAKTLAASGLPTPPDKSDIPQLAAWTVVSNVLLNLDEALTKE